MAALKGGALLLLELPTLPGPGLSWSMFKEDEQQSETLSLFH